MPAQKPGTSKQDYGTPPEFLGAVCHLLDIPDFDADLAADDLNAVAYPYFTKERSAFDAPTWKLGDGWNWLNPPFSHIGPWVARAYQEAVDHDARTAVLIPASIGANWWRDFVHGEARVYGLNRRITFVGCEDAYPKDCALLLYSRSNTFLTHPVYNIWTWRA